MIFPLVFKGGLQGGGPLCAFLWQKLFLSFSNPRLFAFIRGLFFFVSLRPLRELAFQSTIANPQSAIYSPLEKGAPGDVLLWDFLHWHLLSPFARGGTSGGWGIGIYNL